MIVPVDSGHLRYREAGAGPPVVLLHGGGLDLHSWDDQVGPLSADHRVITPDARGHGGSSTAMLALFEDLDAAEQAKDLHGWLDAFLRLASGPHRRLDEVDPAVAGWR